MKVLKIYRYIIILTVILCISCKNDKVNVNQSSEEEIMENPVIRERMEEMRKKSTPLNIPKLRAQAASILEFRSKQGQDSYAIIEADTWEYQFVFDGEMSEQGAYTGVWIDFYPDGRYEYGKYDKIEGSGRYNFHFDRFELLMLDDDESIKPQEWSVKVAGDAMVLVGTATYKDNSMQMKLERVKETIKTGAN